MNCNSTAINFTASSAGASSAHLVQPDQVGSRFVSFFIMGATTTIRAYANACREWNNGNLEV